MKVLKFTSQSFWAAGIFMMPFSVFLLLWQSTGQGSFNPYTSSSLYVSELLILIAAILWIGIKIATHKPKPKKKERAMFIMALGLILLATSFAQDQISALLALIPILAGMGAVMMVRDNVLPLKTVQRIFVGSMALQGLLAILQILLQHSIGLSFLGEALISAKTVGVAKLSLAGKTIMRAYGTLPHANVLAGFSLVALFSLGSIPKKYKTPALILVGLGFFLAISKAALIALYIGLIITKKINQRVAISILIILYGVLRFGLPSILEQEFVQERMQYIGISSQIIIEHPEGLGTSQFTARMQEFTEDKLQPWQFQPVHNIYLLIFNEFGFWTLLIMSIGLKKLVEYNRKRPEQLALIIALLIIGLFDHYLITLPQGLLLSGLVLGIATHPKTVPTKSG
jgi:hypothetical protein